MKTNNKHNKGFFARIIMAIMIMTAVVMTDCSVVKAAELSAGPMLEVIGDLEIVIKRGSNYVDSGCKVVQNGRELPDLTDKVVTKYYEIRQVEGKWQEVLLNPFDTKRIAKVKIRYSCEIVVNGKITTIEAERDLDIIDQYDPKYDAWAKGQIAAQKAAVAADKQKGVVTTSGNANGDERDDNKPSDDNKPGSGNKPGSSNKPGGSSGGAEEGDEGGDGSGGGSGEVGGGSSGGAEEGDEGGDGSGGGSGEVGGGSGGGAGGGGADEGDEGGGGSGGGSGQM